MTTQNPMPTQPQNPQTVLPAGMRFSSDKAQKQAIKNQIALLSFVDDLIKEKKDPAINEKNLAQIKALLLQEINDAINRHLISLLTEDDAKELDVLMEKNPADDEIDNFFAKKIPNLDVEIASVLLNFRAAYLYPLTAQKTEDRKQKTEERLSASSLKSGLPPAPVAKL